MPASTSKGKDSPKKTEKKAPARVQVSASGRVGKTMKLIQKAFTDANDGMTCRFVYDPLTNKDVTQVPSRLADGWRFVEADEIGDVDYIDITYFLDDRGRIRFSDTVLMKIPIQLQAEIRAETQDMADRKLDQVQQNFEGSLQGIRKRGRSGVHGLRSRGKVTFDVEEREVDRPQPSSDNSDS